MHFHAESKYGNENLNFEIFWKKNVEKLRPELETVVKNTIKGSNLVDISIKNILKANLSQQQLWKDLGNFRLID